MNRAPEGDFADAAAALDAISREAFRRKGFLRRIALRLNVRPWVLVASPLIAFVYLVVLPFKTRHDDPVAILLPGEPCSEPAAGADPCLQLMSSVAGPQEKGFKKAWEDRLGLNRPMSYPHKIYYQFPLPSEAELPEIERLFETLYDDGIRYFIITMSDTVLKLTSARGAWEEFAGRHRIDPPILIATVASAPLPPNADIGRRVIRNYIRSDDEVNQFAAYIDSLNLKDVRTDVFVLYIDDRYGQKASELLEDKLRSGENFHPFAIPVGTSDYGEFFAAHVRPNIGGDGRNQTFVVLVGYGDMIVGMLDALNGFHNERTDDAEGTNDALIDEVLVVSTLTEKDWQPKFYGPRGEPQLIPRIITLAPFSTGAPECQGGVVCQFAYMTLRIVLECEGELGMKRFFDCFVDREHANAGRQFPDIELSAKGDSIVPLRVAVTERASD